MYNHKYFLLLSSKLAHKKGSKKDALRFMNCSNLSSEANTVFERFKLIENLPLQKSSLNPLRTPLCINTCEKNAVLTLIEDTEYVCPLNSARQSVTL